MPVTPRECIDNFEHKDMLELEKIQKDLDAKLLSSYHGQPSISFTFYNTINARVRKRLEANYTKAGWGTMSFKEDHCNDPREPYTSTIVTLIPLMTRGI